MADKIVPCLSDVTNGLNSKIKDNIITSTEINPKILDEIWRELECKTNLKAKVISSFSSSPDIRLVRLKRNGAAGNDGRFRLSFTYNYKDMKGRLPFVWKLNEKSGGFEVKLEFDFIDVLHP